MAKARLQAFTLIELLISLTILSVIAGLSYTSFVSVRRAADLNRRDEEMQRSIRGFIERLDVELAGAIFLKDVAETSFSSRRSDIEGKKVNSLSFATAVPQSLLEIGTREEVVKVEYSMEKSEADGEKLSLTKKIFFHTLADELESPPAHFIIRDDFTEFTLRFFKGGTWYDDWDSSDKAALPDGVELTFSLGNKTYRAYFNIFTG